MKLHVEWSRPIQLRDASKDNMIYTLDLNRVGTGAGIYIFGRRWGSQFEALYVGKASNSVRGRVKNHLNNLRLMQHLRNAKTGRRFVLTGEILTKRGQRLAKSLTLTERALIRYFLSEGHDLVNKQGTRIRRHELESSGKHPKRFFPREMYLEKAKGE
ncbi:MAG: hypothetical protein AB1714_18030 [Acidobacteriota bacterium]